MATVSYILNSESPDFSFDLSNLDNGMLYLDQVFDPVRNTVPRIAIPSTETISGDFVAGSTFLAQINNATCSPGSLLVGNDIGRWSLFTISGADVGQVLGIVETTPTPTLGWIENTAGSVTSVAVSSSDLTVGGSPITTSGTITLDLNTVGIAKGGTGQVTKAAAFNALSPMTTAADLIVGGASGTGTRLPVGVIGYTLRVLSSTTLGWSPIGTGTVTSVAVTSSDLTVGGSPITTAGTVTLALNTVGIDKGGTGEVTKTPAFDALSPLSTQGDIIWFDGTNNVRLAGGSLGKVLTVSEVAPIVLSWQNPAQTLWVSVSGTSQALVRNTGYFANNVATTTFTLPLTAAVGDMFEIVGPALWVIEQNAGQKIIFGNTLTTLGVGGSIASTNTGDTIRFVCSDATPGAEVFRTLCAVGELTIV